MLAGPNRTAVTKKSFIEVPNSMHVGDKYLDPEKVDYLYEKKFHGKSSLHELSFKPASGLKEPYTLKYSEPMQRIHILMKILKKRRNLHVMKQEEL